MHLGKPLRRRVVTPKPEEPPEPLPGEDPPVRVEEPADEAVNDPQPTG